MANMRWNKPYSLSFYFKGDESKHVWVEKFYEVHQYEKWRLTFQDFVVYTHESEKVTRENISDRHVQR